MQTNKKYLRYIIPNVITLIRVVLTIIFIVFLNNEFILERKDQSIINLAIIFFVICLTDFVDGKTARYLKATSILGSFFDVISDFIFILCATMTLVKFQMVPMWFLAVIIVKFIDFVATSKIINNYKLKREKVFVFDYMGRVGALLFYGLPFIVIFINKYFSGTSTFIVLLLICISTIIALISLTQRIIMCIQIKRESLKVPNN